MAPYLDTHHRNINEITAAPKKLMKLSMFELKHINEKRGGRKRKTEMQLISQRGEDFN